MSRRSNSSNIPSFNLDVHIKLIDKGEASAFGTFGIEVTSKKDKSSTSNKVYANKVPHRAGSLDNLSQHLQYTLSCSYLDDHKE
jgi:hypothetical protein